MSTSSKGGTTPSTTQTPVEPEKPQTTPEPAPAVEEGVTYPTCYPHSKGPLVPGVPVREWVFSTRPPKASELERNPDGSYVLGANLDGTMKDTGSGPS